MRRPQKPAHCRLNHPHQQIASSSCQLQVAGAVRPVDDRNEVGDVRPATLILLHYYPLTGVHAEVAPSH